MALSSELVTELVKTTNDNVDNKNETTVYGTIVEYNGFNWVRIDGSDRLTPISTTADVKPGERVTVLIKNHNATVTGNISSPSARTDDVKEVGGKVEELGTKISEFEIVIADKVSTKELEVERGRIDKLVSDNITVKGELDAANADIKNLETEKLSATDADIRYAKIDFANIGDAAIENFYAKSGVIQDVVISDGQVTGTLVGVTIKGDLIEGGTVVADKLVIQGEDGLYYKLNTNGETISSEQTEYNSLSGTIITAKSVTAEKIAVDDLVAFDATIGGFKISTNSIYSGVKESVNNDTRGIYMDNQGQVAFGDSQNFIKYYKDANGDYKLEISAKSIKFGASGSSVEDAIAEAQATADAATKDIQDIGAKLELKLDTDKLISQINASADEINLTGDRITINSTHFKLDADGTVTSVGGTISGAQIEGATGSFTGQLNANSGNVGSFIIMDGTLYSSAEHTVTGGSAVTVFTLNGNPAMGEAGDGPPEIRFTGAYQGIPRSAAAWITVAGGAENSDGVTSFDRLELGAATGTQSRKLEISSNGVHTNGAFSADSNITTGGSIGFTRPYSDGNRSIYCKWKDGSNHDLIVRNSDGLGAAVGWKGSPNYDTKLDLRARTVRLINSSGTSTLSDERMKKDWKNLDGYDAFFDALNPQAFRYIDGTSGRYHLGFGAQSVERALVDGGLDNTDFGGLIKYTVPLESDDWRGYDEEYGLIYTEFVALLVDQVQQLKIRVSELESQQASMEQRLAALEKLIGG